MVIPTDLDVPRIFAMAFLLFAWFSYSTILGLIGRGTLNNQLIAVRRQWIWNIGERENSPFDAIMLGHIIHSVAFFGSATLIVLAALLSFSIYIENVHATVMRLHFVHNASLELFALMFTFFVFVVTVCFFSFIYSLRKLIYATALIGALPKASARLAVHAELVEHITTVLTEALRTFNFGIRGFYYAVAALFLFVSPAACIIITLIVASVLIQRQYSTKTAYAISSYVAKIEESQGQEAEE